MTPPSPARAAGVATAKAAATATSARNVRLIASPSYDPRRFPKVGLEAHRGGTPARPTHTLALPKRTGTAPVVCFPDVPPPGAGGRLGRRAGRPPGEPGADRPAACRDAPGADRGHRQGRSDAPLGDRAEPGVGGDRRPP